MIDWIYPVGHVIATVNPAYDPNKLFKTHTWERFAKGKTLVGVDEVDPDFDEAAKTGGEKTHTLAVGEMPSHTHYMTYATNWDGKKSSGWIVGTNSGSRVDRTGSTGDGFAHNNMQPYITVYYWQRTS